MRMPKAYDMCVKSTNFCTLKNFFENLKMFIFRKNL